MSIHLPATACLPRRRLLQLLATAGLGGGLSACGGGGAATPAAPAPQPAPGQTQADAAVAAGLVGMAVGLVLPAATHMAVAGRRRLGEPDPVRADDRFAIGSATKAMTSAAVLALAARGGPALSLTVAQALAGSAGAIHPALAAVTLADLLNHRGGLPGFPGGSAEERAFLAAVDAEAALVPGTAVQRRARLAQWLVAQPPVAGITPGRDRHYSNAGYVLAAAMVEAHTGRDFDSLFDEVLVQPLGLQGGWRSPVPAAQDALQGHAGPAAALAVVQATPDDIAHRPWHDSIGPAGLWACPADACARWLHWHVRALRGEHTPLAPAYVDGLREARGGDHLWGWVGQDTPGRVLLTHTGHVPGFMSEVVLDRRGDFAAFGLSNTGHMSPTGDSWVLQRIDQALIDLLRQQGIAL